MAEEEEDLIGHNGAGDDCVGKVIQYASNGVKGGVIVGLTEGCYLQPIPGSKTPIVFRSLGLAARRASLYGSAAGLYIGTACLSAKMRDRDDYKNSMLGGFVAGFPFGVYYRRIGIGLVFSGFFAFIMGAYKFTYGNDFPNIYNFVSIKPRSEFGPRSLLEEDTSNQGNDTN